MKLSRAEYRKAMELGCMVRGHFIGQRMTSETPAQIVRYLSRETGIPHCFLQAGIEPETRSVAFRFYPSQRGLKAEVTVAPWGVSAAVAND